MHDFGDNGGLLGLPDTDEAGHSQQVRHAIEYVRAFLAKERDLRHTQTDLAKDLGLSNSEISGLIGKGKHRKKGLGLGTVDQIAARSEVPVSAIFSESLFDRAGKAVQRTLDSDPTKVVEPPQPNCPQEVDPLAWKQAVDCAMLIASLLETPEKVAAFKRDLSRIIEGWLRDREPAPPARTA